MMHKMLEKLKQKMGESKLSPEHKEAKKSMLMELMKHMDGMMVEPIKGLKKVTVASQDEEGLKEGLDKAKEMVSDKENAPAVLKPDHSSMDDESEEDESEEESSEDEEMSLDDIEEQIKKLEELKKAKSGKM